MSFIYFFKARGVLRTGGRDRGANPFHFTDKARTVYPELCGKLKAEYQNNDLLIHILRIILIRRAGNSFLESECIDSRGKSNDL